MNENIAEVIFGNATNNAIANLSIEVPCFMSPINLGTTLKVIRKVVNEYLDSLIPDNAYGSVNWGHLSCVDCELVINLESAWSINVYVKEADPDSGLGDAIALHLGERFPALKDKIAVICEW